MIGVEPTWIAPLDPKSSASANFATSAFQFTGHHSWYSAKGLQKYGIPLKLLQE